uniref:F-box domain-containing protein n=1 Tax=Tetranychus urticae TaxID=32264 RepID=T1K4F8_TETUR
MLINELPDDCLLAIFDAIQDSKDLINCFKVREKWCNVIVGRTKRVKYLINQPLDYFWNFVQEPVDVTSFRKLFPNLRIAEFSYLHYGRASIEGTTKLIRGSESLKGIIYDGRLCFEYKTEHANLEMLSSRYIRIYISNISGPCENVKQLRLFGSDQTELECLAHYFPNLERLHISRLKEDTTKYPVLANLKIVEINLYPDSWFNPWCSFKFMDWCPALQSAHIRIEYCQIHFNDSIKHANLQDLVIQFHQPLEWNDLQRLMSKYPNLKHLAIRGTSLRDEHIKQLILILSKLTLLDVRESHGVTRRAADLVRDYCKRYGRSIKFYFKRDDKQIESDWPQLLNRPDKICRGFDFMEHCFFKSFGDLPHLLDPIDD